MGQSWPRGQLWPTGSVGAGHRVSRPRGTGSVGDSVGEGARTEKQLDRGLAPTLSCQVEGRGVEAILGIHIGFCGCRAPGVGESGSGKEGVRKREGGERH